MFIPRKVNLIRRISSSSIHPQIKHPFEQFGPCVNRYGNNYIIDFGFQSNYIQTLLKHKENEFITPFLPTKNTINDETYRKHILSNKFVRNRLLSISITNSHHRKERNDLKILFWCGDNDDELGQCSHGNVLKFCPCKVLNDEVNQAASFRRDCL